MKDSFKKILVLGAGPVVIGQSSELDYAGTQICRALKQKNIKVVAVNSNPATLMTDKSCADTVYLEPLQAENIKKILKEEQPDAVCAFAAGKKGVELCLELEQNGDFAEYGVKLLDIQPQVQQTLTNRRAFQMLLESLNLSYLQEEVVNTVDEALAFAEKAGFPISIRAAFSADAGAFTACADADTLKQLFNSVQEKSVLGQVAVQKCITDYKEIDVLCARDAAGSCKVLCLTEYLETIGIHSGDSMAVLPAVTLSEEMTAKLEQAAVKIAHAVSLCGIGLFRFAVNAENSEYIAFGAETAFDRGFAFASKALGISLPSAAVQLALGASLDNSEAFSLLLQRTDASSRVSVRLPKWSLEQFGEKAYRHLSGAMKSTGEIFAIGADYAAAFSKILLSLAANRKKKVDFAQYSDDAVLDLLSLASDLRLNAVFEALKRNLPLDTVVEKSKLSQAALLFLKQLMLKEEIQISAAYKSNSSASAQKILVVGAGSTSIGLGTDRDFAVSLALQTLSESGRKTAVINDNPSANSTAYTAADAVYIEPICDRAVAQAAEKEQVTGTILAFGGGNAVRKSELLRSKGIAVYGPDAEMHKTLKNRLAFDDLLDKLNIRHTDSRRVLVGKGAQVDVLCDGQDILIPGICEHVEKAKVHSGDSLYVYPSRSFSDAEKNEILSFAKALCCALQLKGVLNMQFVVYDHEVYVTSASVVATRNLPFMSKATGLPIVQLATRLMLGETLSDFGLGTGLYRESKQVYVRMPVFSFEHLEKIDVRLGGAMRSTGEVVGIGSTYDEAVYKAFLASGMRLKRTGGVMLSVADSDKPMCVSVGEAFLRQGFKIYATANTAKLLNANHIAANAVRKIHEGEPNTLDLILQNKISYLISTAEEASSPNEDDVKIRRTALLRRIPVLPSVEMALALSDCLEKNNGLEEIKIYKQ